MDRQRILKQALELYFKGKRPMGWLKTRWVRHILEDTKKEGRIW
jgi:hypothetical protein